MNVFDPTLPGEPAPAREMARQWLGLAFVVLVLAGFFAFAVVVARTPPFDRFVTDPSFFRRCLVAHVSLALVLWFYSFVAALFFMLPSRRPPGAIARASGLVAGAGIALLLAGAAVPAGRPLLSNYIPTIDNALFPLGQLVFGLGVLMALFDRRVLGRGEDAAPEGELPPASRTGLRAVALALLLAALTFGITALRGDAGVPGDVRTDFLVWGLGHVLQLASEMAMIAVWIALLTPALGAPPVSRGAARALFLCLLLPWSAAPLFALQGTTSLMYRHGFTSLMRWCLFPIVSVFLVLCLGALVRAWRARRIGVQDLRDPRLSAFLVSAALTVLGFVLGAAIRGSNTMVPAHYHAAIGAVTVAFMAQAYALLPAFGVELPRGRAARAAGLQPALYGFGMLVFAGGFALAGAYGLGRKLYGAEQSGRGLGQTIGLGFMGVGGLLAIAGGLLFLGVVVTAWWTSARAARTGFVAEAAATRRP